MTDAIDLRWATRRQFVIQVLDAFFVGNALLAELIGPAADVDAGAW